MAQTAVVSNAQALHTLSTIGGLRSMMYCCVPTTSNLPCCQASSLVTVSDTRALQHKGRVGFEMYNTANVANSYQWMPISAPLIFQHLHDNSVWHSVPI